MPLEIYKRRHSSKCLAAITKRVAAGEIIQPTDIKQYRACKCAWWIGGTNDHGKQIPRHSLKVYSYEAACEQMKKLNQPEASLSSRMTIQGATEAWLRAFADSRPEDPNDPYETTRQYARCAERLLAFTRQARITYLRDLEPQHLELYFASWTKKDGTPMKHGSKRTYRRQVHTFLNYCMNKKFITYNPILGVEKLKHARKVVTDLDLDLDEEQATMPLDPEGGDANYRKLVDSVIPFFNRELPLSPRGVFIRYPENFQTLLELMYASGLRISDAARFRPDKIVEKRGRVFYTTRQVKIKTEKSSVTVYFLPHQMWLVEKLRKLPCLDAQGKYPFLPQIKGWRAFVSNNISLPLSRLGDAVGLEGIRCHRFRDSFAINHLNDGGSMTELQKLLGHKSISTTERYYAPWTTSQEDALYDRLERLRQEKEALNIVAIDQRKAG